MRVEQPAGHKGSLKWMQRAVNLAPHCLQPPGLPTLARVSPRARDGYAEYRDGDFLDRLALGQLAPALTNRRTQPFAAAQAAGGGQANSARLPAAKSPPNRPPWPHHGSLASAGPPTDRRLGGGGAETESTRLCRRMTSFITPTGTPPSSAPRPNWA